MLGQSISSVSPEVLSEWIQPGAVVAVVRLLVVSISWPPPQTQGGSLRPARPAGEADG